MWLFFIIHYHSITRKKEIYSGYMGSEGRKKGRGKLHWESEVLVIYFFFCFFVFFFDQTVCGILVPWQGIKPIPLAWAAQSLNHWTTREVPEKVKVSKSVSLVAQSCPTLCNLMDCSSPGSSVHRIFQARTLEHIAIPFSRRSSQPKDPTRVSRIAVRFFTIWATREAQRHNSNAGKTAVISHYPNTQWPLGTLAMSRKRQRQHFFLPYLTVSLSWHQVNKCWTTECKSYLD